MKSQKENRKEQERLAKLKIENKKMFFQTLKIVANTLAGTDIYSWFPAFFLNFLFDRRFYKLQIETENDTDFNRKELNFINHHLSNELRKKIIDIEEVNAKLPLPYMIVEGYTLIVHISKLEGTEFERASDLKDLFTKYNLESPIIYRINLAIYEGINSVCASLSTIYTGYIGGKHIVKLNEKTFKIENTVVVSLEKPTIKYFEIDGNSRPAFRLGMSSNFLTDWYVNLKASVLGLVAPNDEKNNYELKVYVQSHALKRLEERLGLFVPFMHIGIVNSVTELKFHWDERQRLMINYKYFDVHIGYLVCCIQGRDILIQSFLFITFNGTPEGNLLNKLTGLNKIDKKYLAIDNLSSFLSHNIDESPFAKEIFIQAGCSHLLKLKTRPEFKTDKKAPVIDADLIHKYITSMSEIPQFNIDIQDMK